MFNAKVLSLSAILLLTLSPLMGVLAPWREDPWFPRAFAILPSIEYRYQSYHEVRGEERRFDCPSNDNFAIAAMRTNIYNTIEFAAEFSMVDTRQHHSFHPNDLSARLRYQLWDDIIGDYASVVAGATIVHTFPKSRRDLSIFNHGRLGGELQLCVGKEWGGILDWSKRLWTLAAVGFADRGSSWLRSSTGYEFNLCQKTFGGVILDFLGGLGGDSISCCSGFKGYASVRHRSWDVTVFWRQLLPCTLGHLTGAFGYRLYAKNCPIYAQQVYLNWEIPF